VLEPPFGERSVARSRLMIKKVAFPAFFAEGGIIEENVGICAEAAER
jgi:hypothetical protein